MKQDGLTTEEKKILLKLARQALELGVHGQPLPKLDLSSLTPRLQADGATFVTLTIDGQLRGCIGALDPYQPLAEDVREHAIAAALNDYRFPPVQTDDLAGIKIEVSRLTIPQPFEYDTPDELIAGLRPNIDGVLLRDGSRKATFLPQVWEKIPDPVEFLGQLCYKMGAPQNYWRQKTLEVFIYQVEEFHE